MLDTPIVFFVFNRPDTTIQSFDVIAKIKPKKLLLISDGPRPLNKKDIIKCNETRKIVTNIDWECEVFRNYSETNLGCKMRFSSGLDWAFQKVNKAIILEDDCIPHETFFYYCQELLAKYENIEEIMSISGLNTQLRDNCKESYYFTKHVDIGAWATWRRAWAKNDIDLNKWKDIKSTDFLNQIIQDNWYRKYTKTILNELYEKKIESTWDYQWQFTVWYNNGLSIAPKYNLFENIGQGHPDASNGGGHSVFDHLKAKEMPFPLEHPDIIKRDIEKDRITENNRRIGFKYKLPYSVFWVIRKLYKNYKKRYK